MWKIGNCSSILGEVRNCSLAITPTKSTAQSDRAFHTARDKIVYYLTSNGVRIGSVVMCAVWYLNTTGSGKHTASIFEEIIRDVFKKRPNFLNSAPTSIMRALRLLSAPSVRFCQQTAICPVSLWALVVELHPLNRTCAQAVRRISDSDDERAWRTTCVCV
jgi:hypothetical protein